MKKVISIWLILALLIASVTPVFASEPMVFPGSNGEMMLLNDDGSIEPVEAPESVLDEGDIEEPSEPSEEPTEATEPSDEPSEEPTPDYMLVENPLTVDVSENSVQAIANAVTQTDTLTITTSDGLTVSVPDFVLEVWDDYTYKLLERTNSYNNFYLFDELGALTVNDDGTFILRAKYGKYQYNGGSLEDLPSTTQAAGRSVRSTTLKWANFNIYDSDGKLLRESDVPLPDPTYTISFDTGFDDLIIDDLKSDSFVAPVPSYDGYRFDGWFFDEACTQPFYDGFTFTSSITLFAKWSKLHTIMFDTGIDDFTLDSVSVPNGDSYTVPNFLYSGFTFVGAFTDEDRTVQYVGEPVTDDMTLYLKFEPIVYDVGDLAQQQIDRLEALIYVQMATSVVLCALLVGYFFFCNKAGSGC